MHKIIWVIMVFFSFACNPKVDNLKKSEFLDSMNNSFGTDSSTTSDPKLKKQVADSLSHIKEMDSLLTGRHFFTIQWLSFNKNNPGFAFIKKTDSIWYTIEGEQRNDEGYIKINGIIKPENPKKLIFEGVIEYQIKTINANEICRQDGKHIFLNTKDRKYWRMQDMDGCGATIDYIDLFFD